MLFLIEKGLLMYFSSPFTLKKVAFFGKTTPFKELN